MGNGRICYTGVDPTYFGAGKDYIDPNFPMGTGGIGFLMLKLYEVSGKKEFLDAVKGVPEYMDTVAVKMRAGKLLPHALPDRPDLFYLATATDRQEPTVSTMSCTNSAAMRNTAMRSRSLSKDLRRPVHRRNVRLDTGIRKISAAEPQVS